MNAKPRHGRFLEWCAALLPLLGITIVILAVALHRRFIDSLDDDHLVRGGMAFALAITLPAFGIATLLAAVSVPSAVVSMVRSRKQGRTLLHWFALAANGLLLLLVCPFLLVMLKGWLGIHG